jgi:tetratricopeptide (TPR) repeat protein
MTNLLSDPGTINFGDLPDEVNALLQRGVAAYRHDHALADRLFCQALAAAPEQLPVYFCLYKIHTYDGNLDKARSAAEEGLRVAARQAGWGADWRDWPAQSVIPDGPGRFALYTLKALAFIHLRRDEQSRAIEILDALRVLDPAGVVGWPVVAALAEEFPYFHTTAFIALLHARLASLICWTRYTDQRRRRAPQTPWHRACSSPSMTAN